MNNEQQIYKHNAAVAQWLVKEIFAYHNYSDILEEFMLRHKELEFMLAHLPNVTPANMEDLNKECERLFDGHQFGANVKSVFTSCILLLLTIKYNLLADDRVAEFEHAKRTIPKQKKFFEILAKYKRERRNLSKLNRQERLSEIFSKVPSGILKNANRLLGKNVKGQGYNLALLARLLFELTKSHSKLGSSDNEIQISLFHLFRHLYPEANLLSSVEEWLAAPGEVASGNDFRDYQIKSIKSIIYYSNKSLFKDGAGEVDFEKIRQLLNQGLA